MNTTNTDKDHKQAETDLFNVALNNTIKTANKPLHSHVWRFYDGSLGYQSYVCKTCGVDIQVLKMYLTLEQCIDLHTTIKGVVY